MFSRSALEPVCRGEPNGYADESLRGLAGAGAIDATSSRAAALATLGQRLVREYRAEAVFKNAIANNVLFGRHSPRTTAMLQEFRTGRSKIDCVIVNGSIHGYEIKTELDSPARLAKQLTDYRRVFPLISVITDERLAARYVDLLAETSVGVVALTRGRSSLSIKRPAEFCTRDLSVESMMRSLTKPEYSRVVAAATGSVPEAPSAVYFRACLQAVRPYSPESVQALFADQLRLRRLRSPDDVAHECMRSIRHILVEINPDAAQVSNLRRWLQEPVA